MPALIYIHGGGFIVGNLDTHDRIMRLFAHHANLIVVGIDYTLSPEAKFPQAVEECAFVAKYLHENGSEYKIDGDKISFAGDSGGANLSLASTLYLREEYGDISYIKSLLLYYGAYGLKDSVSMRLYGGDYDGLKKEDLEYLLAPKSVALIGASNKEGSLGHDMIKMIKESGYKGNIISYKP